MNGKARYLVLAGLVTMAFGAAAPAAHAGGIASCSAQGLLVPRAALQPACSTGPVTCFRQCRLSIRVDAGTSFGKAYGEVFATNLYNPAPGFLRTRCISDGRARQCTAVAYYDSVGAAPGYRANCDWPSSALAIAPKIFCEIVLVEL